MGLIEWSDSLSVGIPSIDEQHRELVAILNELHEAMMERRGRDVLGGLFARLIDYTKYHFSHEEELLERAQYAEFTAHRTQHVMLAEKVKQLQAQFEAGKITLGVEVMEFLRDWLRNHIAVSDKRYAGFLSGKSGVA